MLCKNWEKILPKLLGVKRFELIKYFCENADEYGFVSVKIKELEGLLNQSKPTIIATLNFLEQKKLLKKLKNGFYQLQLE
ncbi:ArsR family transcriptional regulator [Campylobacter sp. VTCC 70190]|uniref:ArsR family transcriptional regulator n=1 Tax=Campylobacter sp. VTCC 70190 TaxID=3392118 RepID=UPI00398F00CA